MKDIFLKAIYTARKRGIMAVLRIFAGRIKVFMERTIVRKLSFKSIPADKSMKILYIIGWVEGEGKRYRAFNLLENFHLYNLYGEYRYLNEKDVIKDEYLKKFNLIIIYRTDNVERTQRIINITKPLGIPVIFDIDDLHFDPSIVKENQYFVGMAEVQKQVYIEEFKRFEKVLSLCDFGLASSEYLRQRMEQKGKKAFYYPGYLNRLQVKIASSCYKPQPEKRFIGYMSGTSGHVHDFKKIVPVLERIMDEYSDVYLYIIGYLDIGIFKEEYIDRIIKRPFMHWEKLLKETANMFMNLIPLDITNPLCHSKGELKYYESAIVGVPSVASPVDTHKRCITSGVNGFLAETEEEWYEAIKNLLDSKELYKSIVDNALKHTLENYSPEAGTLKACKVYERILNSYKA